MVSANVDMHSPSHARVMHVYVTCACGGECIRVYIKHVLHFDTINVCYFPCVNAGAQWWAFDHPFGWAGHPLASKQHCKGILLPHTHID